ncbi:BCCT family transporter [Sporosarcina limicola]|uniref:Choline/carnitine/betaine transport n=1 Tax=Sporosarcina limicola TaxID=34101 RepID=A0A927MFV6_9BACL|nr:BCCT family transporter [Sporosarcina limicola]MBE1552996.1 choline/carnitine/betaine transport [Sporosarcina limicola]
MRIFQNLRLSVFVPMSIILLLSIVVGVVAPEAFYNVENTIVQFAFEKFGWLFQLSSVLFLAICIFLTVSKYGNIRIGGPEAKPDLSTWNWFAITLTAGIATGILFWGIAEPITHFMSPPEVLGLVPGSEAAAMFSMTQTFIHWTFSPYAIYGLAGVGIAFAIYNAKLPYQVSSVLYPVFGKKIKGSIGAIVDSLCLFAIVGGVAAVLGVGTMQIATGLNIVTGIPNGKVTWIIIVSIIVATYIFSSYTGLNKGIRWLSDKNTKIFIGIVIFVFIFGPMQFILSLGTQSFGHYIQDFFVRSLYLSPIDGSEWPRWWPIYYWAIWLAYAPLMGMFLARISKGRTIKQFMTMNVGVPAMAGVIWFSIFGGSAISLQLKGVGIWESIQQNGMEVSVFSFLEHYPLSTITSLIFIITVYISIVTMADSMTSTVSSLTIKTLGGGVSEAPGRVKIYWGIIMSSMAIINLLSAGGKISGIDATKQIATIAGFPILFFMLLLAYSTLKFITQQEKYDVATYPETAKVSLEDENEKVPEITSKESNEA